MKACCSFENRSYFEKIVMTAVSLPLLELTNCGSTSAAPGTDLIASAVSDVKRSDGTPAVLASVDNENTCSLRGSDSAVSLTRFKALRNSGRHTPFCAGAVITTC